MKSKLYLLLLSGLLWCACKKTPPPYVDDPFYQNRYNPYIYNYPDTNRFNLPYANPVLNGYTYFYYANSYQLISEGNYQNGTPSGYWKIYYPNGKMMREGNFSNGKLSGYWKFYYNNGNLSEEGNYQNNVRSGTWKSYYNNGKLSSEGNYNNGNREGEWKFFDESGGLTGTKIY